MKTLIISLLLVIIPGFCHGQTDTVSAIISNSDTVREEYLTIVFNGMKAYVSINGEKYEKLTLRSERFYNYNEVLKIMRKYNDQGWVLNSSNFSFNPDDTDYLFIMMTRKKASKEKSEKAQE